MQITCKLFAGLMDFLPDGADGNAFVMRSEQPLSPHVALDRLNVPREQAYLVLVNGIYIAEEDRDQPLADGDVMAAWPPVAGGVAWLMAIIPIADRLPGWRAPAGCPGTRRNDAE